MDLVKLRLFRIEDAALEEGESKSRREYTEVNDMVASLDGDENESNSFWADILYGISKKKASLTSKTGSQERLFKKDEDGEYFQDLLQDALVSGAKQDPAMEMIVKTYCESGFSKECMFMVATVVDCAGFPQLIFTELDYSEGVMTLEEGMSGSNRVVGGKFSSFLAYPLMSEGAVIEGRCKVSDNKHYMIQNNFCLKSFMDYETECERTLLKAIEAHVDPEDFDHDDAFAKYDDKDRRKRPLLEQNSILEEDDYTIYDGSVRFDDMASRHISNVQAVDLCDLGLTPPKVTVKDLTGSTIKLDPQNIGHHYSLVNDPGKGNFLIIKLDYEKVKGPLTTLDFAQSVDVKGAADWMNGKKPAVIESKKEAKVEYLDINAPVGSNN